MIKFKLYFDKDKETAWLNEMSSNGWSMNGFFAGFYRFEPCEKGKYTYQIDFGNKLFSVSDDYKEFMAEADIEIVQTWGFWVFLRKLTAKGDFELYTDVDSQIDHYKKIKKMFKAVTLLEIICLFIEAASATVTKSPVFWAFVFIIFALVIAFINITRRTDNIIRELNERKTGIEEPRNRNVSPVRMAGLFVNSLALLLPIESHYMKLTAQLCAIALMLVGIYLTARKK